MRVRLDDGKTVVKLNHFVFKHAHIALLKNIQLETPNLELVGTGPAGHRIVVPVFRLNLDIEELRFLNPSVAA